MSGTRSLEPALIEWVHHDFRKNRVSYDYWEEYIERHPEGYIFKGPNWFMMGWAQKKLTGDYAKAPGPFWLVFYSRVAKGYNLGDLFRMMPYELPYIGFIRGMRGKKDLKYYPTKHLHKLCETLGQRSGI